MLTEVRLQNFRCFEDHTIPLRRCTVVVGKNNAGKSTLVDALRIVSIVSSRLRTMAFRNPPDWLDIPIREAGISPSLSGIEFNSENLFHRYGNQPAIITASFESSASLRIYVGEDASIHAVVLDGKGSVVSTRGKISGLGVDGVEIMPQVGPLERTEGLLNSDYVKRNISSALASRHFRNQIHNLPQHMQAFQQLSEETWPGLQVRDLSLISVGENRQFSLLVRTDDYVTEVATMGHGLQMWLQTMWFLSRANPAATVILDEPDVYMHPDLQRRLIRYLRRRDSQVVVTTHSVEIMSEIEPDEILVLDRQNRSSFASSFPAVQKVLDHVGSAHNLQLAKLWHARKCLLVEGDDFSLLSDFFDVLRPDDKDGLSGLPHMSIGGWNGFPNAIGSSLLLRNSGGENIAVYCLLDSDYHTDSQIAKRKKQAISADVRLHIWNRKEIENYVLVPAAIHRAIESRAARRTNPPTLSEVSIELSKIVESLHDDAFDGIVGEVSLDDRSLGPSKWNKVARDLMQSRWKDLESRLSVVSGKAVLTQIAKWSQDQFGVSLSSGYIVRSMRRDEVPLEMQRVLESIASASSLPGDGRATPV